MRRSIYVSVVLLACALAAAAQQPAQPSGNGPARVERGPEEQPVLRHGMGSEEAPAIEQHLEKQGSLPENLETPRENGALPSPQIPLQPALQQSNQSAAQGAMAGWPLILAGVVVAGIVLFIWRTRRRASAQA